jgi:hypothetical protein
MLLASWKTAQAEDSWVQPSSSRTSCSGAKCEVAPLVSATGEVRRCKDEERRGIEWQIEPSSVRRMGDLDPCFPRQVCPHALHKRTCWHSWAGR